MVKMLDFGRWLFWLSIVITTINILLPPKWKGTNYMEVTRELAGVALTLLIISAVAMFG